MLHSLAVINAGKTTNTPWDLDNKCQRWQYTKQCTLAAMKANAKQLSLVKYEKCSQNATGEVTSTFILTSDHPQQPLKRLRQLTASAPSDMLTIYDCTKQWYSSNTLPQSCSRKAIQERWTLTQNYTTKRHARNIEQLVCSAWQKHGSKGWELKATHSQFDFP